MHEIVKIEERGISPKENLKKEKNMFSDKSHEDFSLLAQTV